MRVLIACEFSGVVREAFRRRGHDAWSCDLIVWLTLFVIIALLFRWVDGVKSR